jgi:hypothetical protein
MDAEEMEAQSHVPNRVLVASCKPCRCSSGKGQHLCISFESVELHRVKAVAISYTWGEFDRRNVYIGHSDINPDKKINIKLGQEWSIPELWTGFVSSQQSTVPCGWINYVFRKTAAKFGKPLLKFQTYTEPWMLLQSYPGRHHANASMTGSYLSATAGST